MDTDETREAAAGGRYVSNGQHCVACEGDELPDCRRAGIRFAAADRSTDTLPPTPLPTPWVPSAHPPLAYVQETEEHRDTRHTWTAQTPPVRVTSSSVLGGGATLFVAPRSLVFRMMCWRACFCLVLSRQPYAGGLAHYGSTDMVDATQAARVRTSRRAPCSGGQLHRRPRAHPPAPQMSLLQR